MCADRIAATRPDPSSGWNWAALGADVVSVLAPSITVGSALNAAGVIYDVWAITTGLVGPK